MPGIFPTDVYRAQHLIQAHRHYLKIVIQHFTGAVLHDVQQKYFKSSVRHLKLLLENIQIFRTEGIYSKFKKTPKNRKLLKFRVATSTCEINLTTPKWHRMPSPRVTAPMQTRTLAMYSVYKCKGFPKPVLYSTGSTV